MPIICNSYPPLTLTSKRKKRQCPTCKKELDCTLSKRATFCKACANERNAYKSKKKNLRRVTK